jgi:hypothetical protein
MTFLFDSPSWVLSSFFIVAISILLSLLVLWVVRKNFSIDTLKKSHDVVGFTFSIIGVLYSVILGFTVINVQERHNTVLEASHSEAILLADLYQDAGFFPEEDRKRIRESLRRYVNHVITEEWWLSAEKKIHFKTRNCIKDIWESYYHVELNNEKMNIWYTESISKLNNFLNVRLSRQFSSWEHLSGMMWSLLIIGAIITLSFMFFFGLENLHSHVLMIALLAGYLSFMLYLVYSLDNVFKGSQGVKPEALQQVYILFDQWDQDSLNCFNYIGIFQGGALQSGYKVNNCWVPAEPVFEQQAAYTTTGLK